MLYLPRVTPYPNVGKWTIHWLSGFLVVNRLRPYIKCLNQICLSPPVSQKKRQPNFWAHQTWSPDVSVTHNTNTSVSNKKQEQQNHEDFRRIHPQSFSYVRESPPPIHSLIRYSTYESNNLLILLGYIGVKSPTGVPTFDPNFRPGTSYSRLWTGPGRSSNFLDTPHSWRFFRTWSMPVTNLRFRLGFPSKNVTHRFHVWYICLHLVIVDSYGKCRSIYHTWILWVIILVVNGILGSSNL